MKFIGLEPLRESFPIVEVGVAGALVDLHNDADLRELLVDVLNHEVRLTWTLKSPAWTQPERPETADRQTLGTVTLTFSGVTRVRISGMLTDSPEGDAGELDILEYRRISGALGEVRLAFVNQSEIEIVSTRCELRRVAGGK